MKKNGTDPSSIYDHDNPKPIKYPMNESDLFENFADQVYYTRWWDPKNPDANSTRLKRDHVDNPKDVFPYRYASFYVYEANNYTKQFKVAAIANLTSQDVAVLYP